MRRLLFIFLIISLASCKGFLEDNPKTVLHFSSYSQEPFTKGTELGDVFNKLNVMLFNASGEKVFNKVKTQTSDDKEFGTLEMTLEEGVYTVVAVGHSSKVSASIKSPQVVQFTAKDGEKVTDTFNYCGMIDVKDESRTYELKMYRVVAMFRLIMTDTSFPDSFSRIKLEYSGGSANYNPTTGQGITKSSQSEIRNRNDTGIYEIYTFPYLSCTGTLEISASAMDENGTILSSHVFKDVPIKVNTITSYSGFFFGGMTGSGSQISGYFSADPIWSEINEHFY